MKARKLNKAEKQTLRTRLNKQPKADQEIVERIVNNTKRIGKYTTCVKLSDLI